MSLDDQTVARVSKLARIELTADERDRLARELSGILSWIEQLNEVDTATVAPMRSVLPLTRRLRADEVQDGGRGDEVTRNASKRHDGYFVVPRVVE